MRFDSNAPSLTALQKMLLLRRIPAFTAVDDHDLQLIAENVDTVSLVKGEVLYSRDELVTDAYHIVCLLYTSPSPRDGLLSRMPSSA